MPKKQKPRSTRTDTPSTLPTLRRRRVFGSRSGVVRVPQGSLVVELAAATGTDKLVLAALTAAHGWDDETRLTREDFVRAREEWMTQPGRGLRTKRKVTR